MTDTKDKHHATEISTPPERAAQIAADIKTLSFREASRKYSIGYNTWNAIKTGQVKAWLPKQPGDRVSPEVVERILASCRQMPQLNTIARAQALGLRAERTQRVLAAAGLSRQSARLQFAGYSLATSPALSIARQRRVLAAAPGAQINFDFKYFGLLRGIGKAPSVRICGLVGIDQLTGYGDVLLCPTETGDMAAAGLHRFCKRAPFKPYGIVLTDNGSHFTGKDFVQAVTKWNLVHRTTKYHHPWSNGKTEKFNLTLARECFPAILTGLVGDIFQLQELVDNWLTFYNSRRTHTGWINKGLPPLAVIELLSHAKGESPLDRFVSVGILKPQDIEFVRPLGAKDIGKPTMYKGKPRVYSDNHVPYGFVVDRSAQAATLALRQEAQRAKEATQDLNRITNMSLATKASSRNGKDPRALPLIRRRATPERDGGSKHQQRAKEE
jgi:transposase InsO family protein